jgi:hypothetical protein
VRKRMSQLVGSAALASHLLQRTEPHTWRSHVVRQYLTQQQDIVLVRTAPLMPLMPLMHACGSVDAAEGEHAGA